MRTASDASPRSSAAIPEFISPNAYADAPYGELRFEANSSSAKASCSSKRCCRKAIAPRAPTTQPPWDSSHESTPASLQGHGSSPHAFRASRARRSARGLSRPVFHRASASAKLVSAFRMGSGSLAARRLEGSREKLRCRIDVTLSRARSGRGQSAPKPARGHFGARRAIFANRLPPRRRVSARVGCRRDCSGPSRYGRPSFVRRRDGPVMEGDRLLGQTQLVQHEAEARQVIPQCRDVLGRALRL